jgi:NAD+ kinase
MEKYPKWIDKYDQKKYIQEKDGYIEACGGDGTLLKAISMHSNKNKPFYGIAAGTENFMMNEKNTINNPSRNREEVKLSLINVRATYVHESYDETINIEAFNELHIGSFGGWIDFKFKDKDNILGSTKGAGIIISTAQGTTGINKNNGGTILPLSSKNWSVTSVQSTRKLNYVLEPEIVELECFSRNMITLSIDGQTKMEAKHFIIEISKGKEIELIFDDYDKFKQKRQ